MGGRRILAVVKANAYGHGATEVSRVLVRSGVDALGVAHLEEAIELRKAGLAIDLFLIFGFDPGQVHQVLDYSLTPVLWRRDQADALSAAASERGVMAPVHVKVDTGMGRVGFRPESAVEDILAISRLPGLRLEGVSSHFSDADTSDCSVVEGQLRLFREILAELGERGVSTGIRHIANSAAILRFPEAHLDMVRPGLMLYGYNPLGPEHPVDLQPVMTVRTAVVALKQVSESTPVSYGRTFRTARPSVIATIGVGYADGFFRALSNRGRVLIRGRAVPVVGRVCMDLTMVDVTDIDGVSVGDEVILIGRQGEATLWADEVAGLAGTISYEVLTSVGKRVERIYHDA